MIDYIFKLEKEFSQHPNSYLEIHPEYLIKQTQFAFGQLAKTNVFIGANNSGKSRFLRFLYTSDFYAIGHELASNQPYVFNKYINGFRENYIDENIGMSWNPLYSDYFNKLKADSIRSNSYKRFYFPVLRGIKDYKKVIANKLNSFLLSQKEITANRDLLNSFCNLFSLKSDGLDDLDIYKSITILEYFEKFSGTVKENIITGNQLYNEIKSMLLGAKEERRLITSFQNFLRDNFFDEYNSVQLIPREKEKTLFLKIGNENDDDREIYNWGDGTQQIITLLYFLYKHKDETNCLFFIEEPEMYMHPGILRKFIEVINSSIFKNHQYFITTHSNAILDTSADVDINMSIFKFIKSKNREASNNKTFIIEQCNNGDSSLLLELGVRNSSVFLSNCSIWVEGITDRMYLKHYLYLYKAYNNKHNYRENIDYTFIEYGGGNITHFNFDNKTMNDEKINVNYINNKIFVIADNDNSKNGTKKFKRKKELKSTLKDNFYELKAVEIENLLTKDVITKIIVKQLGNDKESEIIQAFKNAGPFKKEKLGKYIDNTIKSNNITTNKLFSSSSGSIKNKIEFCKCAISILTNYEQLSNEAKTLIEKIYNFIESNNIL